ncbi:MAG: hypothetical protein PWR09_7 [Archaeoglobi archaeon]|nr:hypothetical protein [Archaeoglobi archaeon]
MERERRGKKKMEIEAERRKLRRAEKSMAET